MNLIKNTCIILLLSVNAVAQAQVIKNGTANLTLNLDSVRINNKSPLSLLIVNYQTGEATFKVRSESFSTPDSLLKKFFFQKNNDIELHFVVTKSILDLLTKENKEHAAETAGMLYINNHFHNVQISYNIYNKNGTTIDFANNNVMFSFQCNFNPEDFQLDWLNTYTNEPVLLWTSKQPINFTNTN